MSTKIHPIYDYIERQRNGIFITDIEVNDLEELKSFLDNFYNEFIQMFKIQTLTSYFNLVTVYCLNEEEEEAVNNFDIKKYLRNL